MKEYIKINIASPQKILQWTERGLPNGELIGEVTTSSRLNSILNCTFFIMKETSYEKKNK